LVSIDILIFRFSSPKSFQLSLLAIALKSTHVYHSNLEQVFARNISLSKKLEFFNKTLIMIF